MNKMIKLPLFLAIVGGICGGALAGINALTAKKIKADEDARIAEAYKIHFENIASSEEIELSDNLLAAGVSSKINAKDESGALLGSIYTATVKGYAGKVTFTVSFADTRIVKFIQIAGAESAQGANFINAVSNASNFSVDQLVDYKSGSSVTYGAVSKCINVCYADFKA